MSMCQSLSWVQLFATPWTVACQTSLPMECSRQEYWSGLPLPSSGNLPKSGIKLRSPALQADSLPCEQPGKPQSACSSRQHSSFLPSKSFTWALLLTGGGTPFAAMMGGAGKGNFSSYQKITFPICRSGSNSQNWTWNNRLVPNRKRSTSRLYIVSLLI